MRRIPLLYITAIALLTMITTSCNKDEEVDPTRPSITLLGDTELNETISIGESITFSFSTAKGTIEMDRITFREDGAPLSSDRFTINGETLTTSTDYSIALSEDAGKTYEIVLQAAEAPTTEIIRIAVIDKNDLTDAFSVTLTTE